MGRHIRRQVKFIKLGFQFYRAFSVRTRSDTHTCSARTKNNDVDDAVVLLVIGTATMLSHKHTHTPGRWAKDAENYVWPYGFCRYARRVIISNEQRKILYKINYKCAGFSACTRCEDKTHYAALLLCTLFWGANRVTRLAHTIASQASSRMWAEWTVCKR